ncbi:MAG: hypothetical protein R8G66_31705 [Cytophagales bacterium]|nr:hypothetical protein [Cytophagales bacterium]
MRKTNTVPTSIRSLTFGHTENSWISPLLFLLLIFITVLTGCDTQNGVDREAVKREMANRELKRLRNSDIVRRGEEIGKKYFDISEADQLQSFTDSLAIKVTELKSAETEEEKELQEAFLYASENNQDLTDYLSDTPELVYFYHPEIVEQSLVITRLTITKKAIVKSL